MPRPYEIRWSYRSLHDLARLREFLVTRNPQAADRAIAEIQELVYQLENSPLMGVMLSEHDVRREIYPRFGRSGYSVRYSVD